MAYIGQDIADVAVTVGQGVIDASHIVDSSITTADIGNDAITANKIDDDGTGFQMGSLGLGTAVSGSEKLTVGGTASFSGAITGSSSITCASLNVDGAVDFDLGGSSNLNFGADTDGVHMYVGSNQFFRILGDAGSDEWVRWADGGSATFAGDVNISTSSDPALTFTSAEGGTDDWKIYIAGTGLKFRNTTDSNTAFELTEENNAAFSGQANFGTTASFIKQSNFGYSSSYKVLQLGLATSTSAISIGADLTGNASGGFTGNEIVIPNARGILAPNNANNAYLGVLAVTSSDTIEIGRGNHSIINTSGNAISINTSNNNTTFSGNIVGKTNTHISYSSGNATNTATGGAFNASGSDIVTGRLFIQGYQNTGNDLIGFNNETNQLVLYNYTDGAYLMKIAHGATLSANFGASMLNLYNNDTGSAGSTNKQLSLGDSDSTYWNSTNSGTFTGAIISNSHNDAGTACGVAFSHRTGSSGISYIVSRNEGADASSLHFGTRGTGGVDSRMTIGKDGEITVSAASNNKASINVVASGSGHAPNDAKVYVQKNSNADWSFLAIAGSDDYGFKTKGVGSYAITVTNHSSDTNVFRVEYDGDILAANTSISSISDRRLKKEITNANSQWDDIKALNFVNYKWKKSTGMDDSIKYLGLVADEVESVSPGLIKIDAQSKEDIEAGAEDPEYKTVKYSIVWMKAVKALQEAMAKIETLEAKVEALENA